MNISKRLSRKSGIVVSAAASNRSLVSLQIIRCILLLSSILPQRMMIVAEAHNISQDALSQEGSEYGSRMMIVAEAHNISQDALSQEGSEYGSVFYLSGKNDFVPVDSIQSKYPMIQTKTGESLTGPEKSYNVGAIELDGWHPDTWEQDTNQILHANSTKVQHIEAECQDDYMKIRIGFNSSFTGLLYSAGYSYDPDCIYINGTGRDYYEFYIQLNKCGTLGRNALLEDNRRRPTKNFMWNTITVQYNILIEEEFDEHFKVTCEYGYDFWKTVTFPFLDVEVATGNPVVFTLSPPECYMEIKSGYDVNGSRVTGPVRVGDPLTLIIYMRSRYDGFDLSVSDCYAHNGANKKIQLIDEFGCPDDDKLISNFRGSWSEAGVYETQVYAYMKTFRFTGSPALYIECDVRMCHGRCPSQRCHWRSSRNIIKRETSDQNASRGEKEIFLSENINLFQALHVLQEDEVGEDKYKQLFRGKSTVEVCFHKNVLSAIAAGVSFAIFVLLLSLIITCGKLYRIKNDAKLFDAYINPKGEFD